MVEFVVLPLLLKNVLTDVVVDVVLVDGATSLCNVSHGLPAKTPSAPNWLPIRLLLLESAPVKYGSKSSWNINIYVYKILASILSLRTIISFYIYN